jgi:hypothetical protein
MLLGQMQSSRVRQQGFAPCCCSDATIACLEVIPNAERCRASAKFGYVAKTLTVGIFQASFQKPADGRWIINSVACIVGWDDAD